MNVPEPDALAAALERIVAAAAWQADDPVSRGRSVQELRLLRLLSMRPTLQAQVAGPLGLSRSGTGALIQRLEVAGLLERRADPEDRRLRTVALTDGARERLREDLRWLTEEAQALSQDLEPGQRETLTGFMVALADAAERVVERATQRDPETRRRAPDLPSLPLLWG